MRRGAPNDPAPAPRAGDEEPLKPRPNPDANKPSETSPSNHDQTISSQPSSRSIKDGAPDAKKSVEGHSPPPPTRLDKPKDKLPRQNSSKPDGTPYEEPEVAPKPPPRSRKSKVLQEADLPPHPDEEKQTTLEDLLNASNSYEFQSKLLKYQEEKKLD